MESMKTLGLHAGTNFDSRRLLCKAGESDHCGMGEGFRIDDLLDFTNDDIGGPIGDDCTSLSNHTNDSSVTGDETFTSQGAEKGCARTPNMSQELGNPSEAGLCVPSDELADLLGWLSNFAEDSYSTDETHGPLFTSSNFSLGNEKSTVSTISRGTSLSPSSSVVEDSTAYSGRPWSLSPIRFVPGRARSKRSRTGGLVWSHRSLVPAFSENEAETDMSGDSQVYSSEEEVNDSVRPAKREHKAKQAKKSMDVSQTRRCTHCQAQKTPQWRAGPMGPKTLCNACGVRYKSGRLVPEYRPVASPSFSSEMHSNSHRRIIEMRRQKEQEPQQQHSESMQIVYKEDPDTILSTDDDKECNLTDEIQQ